MRVWSGLEGGVRPPGRIRPGERFQERVRNPEGEHLIRPNVFGVGWTVHLANVVALVRRGVSSASPGVTSPRPGRVSPNGPDRLAM